MVRPQVWAGLGGTGRVVGLQVWARHIINRPFSIVHVGVFLFCVWSSVKHGGILALCVLKNEKCCAQNIQPLHW